MQVGLLNVNSFEKEIKEKGKKQMNKTKMIARTTMLAILVLGLAVCLVRAAGPEGPDQLIGAPNLTVSGSSTVFPISSSAQTDFQTATGITLTLENIGSGPGLDKLLAGTTDVAASSKVPEAIPTKQYWNDSVWSADNSSDLNIFAIAKDSVVIIVPKTNTWLTNASTKQIADIYRSTNQTNGIALYTYWDDVPFLVGAPHQLIDRITRFMDDGTHDCFNKFFMNANGYNTGTTAGISWWLPSSHVEVATNQLMITTVSGDPYAIGYAAMGIYEGALNQVNGVSINGVAPSTANVNNFTYKGDPANGSPLIVRYLWYAFNAPIHVGTAGAIKALWVSFVRANMTKYVAANGYIPIPIGDYSTDPASPLGNDNGGGTPYIHEPDGNVTNADLALWNGWYNAYHGPNPTINPYADLNADGKVNFNDLVLFADSYASTHS